MPYDSDLNSNAQTVATDIERALVDLQPALRRYAVHLCRDTIAADDLVQDAMVKALSKIHMWESGTNLKAWVIVVMRNLFLTACRSSRGRSFVPFDSLGDRLGAVGEQEVQLELADVLNAVQRLSSDHQDILAGLCEGKPYAELAKRLNIPVGTVRSRAHRARQALRGEVAQEFGAHCG